MSKSKWSKERDGVLSALFTKLILLETGIRSARNQSIALDFCFSLTKNHTYLTCDESATRSHLRGVVSKLEIQGQDAKAECLSSALDELLLRPVAADAAPGRNPAKFGAVTAQVLAVLRGLEGDVSSLEWKGSVMQQQQHEDGVLLKQVQQDFAEVDSSSEYSDCSSSDLSPWDDEREQIEKSQLIIVDDNSENSAQDAASSLVVATSAASFAISEENSALPTPVPAPLQQHALGQHWQLLPQHSAAALVTASNDVARTCLAERCASGAYSGTIIVEESIIVCETLLMLAGLPSRIFSENGNNIEISADVSVASITPSTCKSWLQSWAQVGSMCRHCEAIMRTDYEVVSPVIQAFVACLRDHLFPFTRFAMHTLELVKRGQTFLLPPLKERIYPGSMIAMDCIMRERVEQIQTLHAITLLFNEAFRIVRPSRSCSHDLLSAMHRRMQLHSSCLSYRARATFARFFRDCFRPIALQLDAYLFASVGGDVTELLELPQRLPVQVVGGWQAEESRADQSETLDEVPSLLNCWHRGVIGADTSLVSLATFLQPLASDIVAAGHASAVLIAEHSPCPSVVDVLSQPSCISDSVTATLDRYISQLQENRTTNPSLSCGSTPFSAVICDGIIGPLRQRCTSLNAALLLQLVQQHELHNWLFSLRRMFVGGDGESAFIMAEAVCSQLSSSNSNSWAPDFTFSSAFQQCLSFIELRNKGAWTAVLAVPPTPNDMCPNLPELDGLDVIINAPWPVSLVVHPAAVARYVKLLRFLLSLRVCHSVLTETSRYSRAQVGSHVAKWMRLRVEMLHIVNNLNNYATTRVVVGPGEDFMKAVSEATCVADVITAQDVYLSTVSDRCLLNPKADTVASLIRMLLTLALRFSSAFRVISECDPQSEEASTAAVELQVVDDEFRRLSRLLISIFSKIVERGFHPHSECHLMNAELFSICILLQLLRSAATQHQHAGMYLTALSQSQTCSAV